MKTYYHLYKLRLLLILAGVLLVVIFNTFPFPQRAQLVLFIVIISVTGIPHGSLDFYLDKKLKEIENVRFSAINFYLSYLAKIALYAVCWYFFPAQSLIFFVFITALHFGEIDWTNHKKSALNTTLYFFYGSFMIIHIIFAHFKETAPILYEFVKQEKYRLQIAYVSNVLVNYAWFIWASYFILLFLLKKKINWAGWDYGVFAFQTALLLFLINALPFYLSFTFYFGIWHSILSFDVIKSIVQINDKGFNWLNMLKKAAPFVVVAVLFVVLILLIRLPANITQLITGLFIAISALTLPHLQVFSNAVKKKSLNSR